MDPLQSYGNFYRNKLMENEKKEFNISRFDFMAKVCADLTNIIEATPSITYGKWTKNNK